MSDTLKKQSVQWRTISNRFLRLLTSVPQLHHNFCFLVLSLFASSPLKTAAIRLVVLRLSRDLGDGLPATTLQGLLRLVSDLGELLVLCDLALLDALVEGLGADVEVLDEANIVITPVVLLAENASGAEHEGVSSAAQHFFPTD